MSSTVAGWRASHVPGRWPVLMGPTSLVVVDPATPDLSGLWEKVLGSASMAELVTALAAIGPDQSPDLVALFWSPNGMRSLVRGGSLRLLDPATAEVVADGAGVLTWREIGLDDREQIEIDLGAGPVGNSGLPLVVGVVHAGALRIEGGEAAVVISPQASRPHPQPQSSAEPDQLEPWSAVGWSEAEVSDAAEIGHADGEQDWLESDQVDPIAAGALWPPVGLTRRTSSPTVEEVVDPVQLELKHGDAEHAPLVSAAICLSGHPNPPSVNQCGLCGAPVPPQTTQSVPRPVLAVLRSPDGTSVPIDRPVLVGRAPVLRDDLAEMPELMRVPSPGQDVSRTHLLVTPDEWEIRLTDLHSTNGTTIVEPGTGQNQRRLPPGEPHPVPVGTVIELGDGVSVLIDGPPSP